MVELVTVLVPSPVVVTVGVNEPPLMPDAGRLEIDGVDEAALSMVKPDWEDVDPL